MNTQEHIVEKLRVVQRRIDTEKHSPREFAILQKERNRLVREITDHRLAVRILLASN